MLLPGSAETGGRTQSCYDGDMNLFTLLSHAAARHPLRGAVFSGVRQIHDWRTLHDRALRLAGALAVRLPPGARIAIAARNCPEYVELLFAAWAAGMVAVPLNAKLHPREMTDIIDDAGAGIVFASADLAGELAGHAPVEIGSAAYAALLDHAPATPAEVTPDTLAWLFFTSGTTGRSKGAMLSHRNLLAMTIAHLADFEDPGPDDGILHAAPMSHGSGLYILPYVARAARQIIPESAGFEPAEVDMLCAHHRGVGMFLAPTMVQRLRLHVEQQGAPIAGLRRIIYGGGPMYLEEIRKALAAMGPVFCQLYGQGEAPMTITGLRHRDFADAPDDVLASVGWPRAGVEVMVADEQGQPLPAGETGEILCRGDVVMLGYWQQPDATAATLAGGWLRTGDMGAMDENGMLTLRDRSKDVIISGGTNIYPREVEEALLTFPGVRETSVVGTPDPEWGEIVVAFVVRDNDTIDEAALDAHCLAQIARFKRPKRYLFVEALLKSSYGKVLKRELAASLR